MDAEIAAGAVRTDDPPILRGVTTDVLLHAGSRRERVVAVLTVVLPTLGFFAALWLLWGRLITAVELLVCVAMYSATALGVTVGFHRLYTHRSFRAPAAVRLLFGILGSMAAQGPLLYWVAVHRQHHQCSDRDGDPHSPHYGAHGPLSLLRGLWHAHVGWIFTTNQEALYRQLPDLLRDPLSLFINRLYVVWVALGVLIAGLATALLRDSWMGFCTGMLWGGLARICLLHHVTWSINSICHLFGAAPFETRDRSRNNVLCALFAFGEGWHNNHHAFPTSAAHGLHWSQLDLSYLLIRLLERVGLATDLQRPTDEQQRKKWRGETRRA
jgi:stearoyl-CoA desaturase (delta-9 desaturase)